MPEKIITLKKVDAVLQTIPEGSNGVGFQLSDVFYAFNRSSSGMYQGKSYTKPAHIQVKTPTTRFWIDRVDDGVEFKYDPAGKMSLVPLVDIEAIRELEILFLNLENHLNTQKRNVQKKTAAPVVNLDDMQLLINTLLQWLDKDHQVQIWKAVESAILDPQQYYRNNTNSLAKRGINAPFSGLYIIALADSLLEARVAVEIDWNSDLETIQWAVSQMTNVEIQELLPAEGSKEMPAEKVLKTIGKNLSRQNLTLTSLDIDSDSYVLCLLPKDIYRQVIELANKVGIKMVKW